METQERTYYSPILESELTGLEKFPVNQFVPCAGSVLVVLLPPKTESDGGIKFTDKYIKDNDIGRVAAIPPEVDGISYCPVSVGDWVVIRHLEGGEVPFDGRKDLRVVQYTDDARSDIVGFFKKGTVEFE